MEQDSGGGVLQSGGGTPYGSSPVVTLVEIPGSTTPAYYAQQQPQQYPQPQYVPEQYYGGGVVYGQQQQPPQPQPQPHTIDAELERHGLQILHDIQKNPVMQRSWEIYPFYRSYTIPWYNGAFWMSFLMWIFWLVAAVVALCFLVQAWDMTLDVRRGLTYTGTIVAGIIAAFGVVFGIQYITSYSKTSGRHSETVITCIAIGVIITVFVFAGWVTVNSKFSDVTLINGLSFQDATVVIEDDDSHDSSESSSAEDDDDSGGGRRHHDHHKRRHKKQTCETMVVNLDNNKHISVKEKVQAFVIQQSVLALFVLAFPLYTVVFFRAWSAHLNPETSDTMSNFLAYSMIPMKNSHPQHQQQQRQQHQYYGNNSAPAAMQQQHQHQSQPQLQQQQQQQQQGYSGMPVYTAQGYTSMPNVAGTTDYGQSPAGYSAV